MAKPHRKSSKFQFGEPQQRTPNPNLPRTTITLRLPKSLLDDIKIAANKSDVSYQSLIKSWLFDKVY